MNRHEQRKVIFKLLFQTEFFEKEEAEALANRFLLETDFEDMEDIKDISEEDAIILKNRFLQVCEKLTQIDNMINENATGWSVGRIGKVELSILRLAIYEIKFDEDIPTKVAIDEAVGLAKEYGQDNAGSFVNGILAKFAV